MAEFEFAGTTFKGGKMFAVLTALSTLGGGAYGGFEVYKDYMDMKEIIQNIDIGAIETANALQIQKLDDAIGYTVEIRDALADDVRVLEERMARDFTALKLSVGDDVSRLERVIDKLEEDAAASDNTIRNLRTDVLNKMDAFEERIRTTQSSIDDTLDGVRSDMNDNTKAVTQSIREVEGTIRASERDVRSTMRETETRIGSDMDILEAEIKQTLQEALDNPLNN
tara:strand:- start:96 stop:770 length:675 start_codon:yes stop_codon:yes gene_type:complete